MSTVVIFAKCDDCFEMVCGEKEYFGYVPSGCGLGRDGSTLSVKVDLETGQILNWNKDKVLEQLS